MELPGWAVTLRPVHGRCQDRGMLNVQFFVLGTTDMGRAIDFWTRALGYVVSAGGAEARWTELVPASGHGAALAFQYSETPVQERPRSHIDLSVADAAEQAAEVDRLVLLGAERVDWDLYPADPDFVVLADPDGNRFCVVDLSHV
jgi:catechol 2,3-dioxygenase-like lactoylglutathione lyase family enzyme